MKALLASVLLFLTQTGFAQTFDSYTATASKTAFYYKHQGTQIATLENLARLHPEIRFAMNIQMYAGRRGGLRPVVLYIENGNTLSKLVRSNNPKVNFGMQPQCVFGITNAQEAILVPLSAYKPGNLKYAVELAPMVVINGAINPGLTRSESRYIRNGVGILRDGSILFAISTVPVTFQEFARFFLGKGCINAAYVDGVVSQRWRRANPEPTFGVFAVMAGVQ